MTSVRQPHERRLVCDDAESEMLDDAGREMLDFESVWPAHSERKARAIAASFHVTAVQYYQLLGRIADDPAALAYDPLVVRRIRRRRGAIQAPRGA